MSRFRDVRQAIKSQQVRLGYKNEEMACWMHMSIASWNRRLSKPETFTVKELIRLEAILKIKLLEV